MPILNRGTGAEISAPVFLLAETLRKSRPASPLPIACRQLHRPFEGLSPPRWTSQFGYITAQARYFLDVLQTGIAVSACPFPTFPTRVLNRPHKMVDVTTTSGPAALFKKFAKIANVRRSSWAIGQAIRIAYCMGLIKKMMLGYGRCACPSSPLATIENLSSQPARHCRMARQPR